MTEKLILIIVNVGVYGLLLIFLKDIYLHWKQAGKRHKCSMCGNIIWR